MFCVERATCPWVAGAAVKGSWLITVGDAESIFVWRINSPGDVPAQPQHKPAQKGHQAGKGSKRPVSMSDMLLFCHDIANQQMDFGSHSTSTACMLTSTVLLLLDL
jgi:hypothetical protein